MSLIFLFHQVSPRFCTADHDSQNIKSPNVMFNLILNSTEIYTKWKTYELDSLKAEIFLRKKIKKNEKNKNEIITKNEIEKNSYSIQMKILFHKLDFSSS